MTSRERLSEAIISLSKTPLDRKDLIKLSRMSYEQMVDKLIRITNSYKYPIKKDSK